jgi:cell division protein ZapE
MQALFERTTGQPPVAGHIALLGRRVAIRGQAGPVIWFDFAGLCGGPRSQLDYLQLAETHALIMVSEVPAMTPAMHAEARRFTWLVDILYDSRVSMAMSAETPLEALYPEGRMAGEFVRTISRLEEMQSATWRAGAAPT